MRKFATLQAQHSCDLLTAFRAHISSAYVPSCQHVAARAELIIPDLFINWLPFISCVPNMTPVPDHIDKTLQLIILFTPLHPSDMSFDWKVSQSYAELQSLLQLARVRTAIRFMDVQRLRPAGELRILNALMRKELVSAKGLSRTHISCHTVQSLLLMHFGYCSIHGFAIPRPFWLISWSKYLFGSAPCDDPGDTLFATLDREEDKAADDSILGAGPPIGFWWSSANLSEDFSITEQDIRSHFQKWLIQVRPQHNEY